MYCPSMIAGRNALMRAIAGRPDLMGGRTSLTVYPGMVGMTENAFINVKNRSYTITAPVELSDDNTNGVIIAQAGAFGGWVLYMKDGKIHHEYNLLWRGDEPTSPGRPRCPRANTKSSMSSWPMLRNRARAASVSSTWTASKWRKGAFRRPSLSSFQQMRAPMSVWTTKPTVSNDYKQGDNKFTGKIVKVTIDTKPSNLSAADKKAVEDAEEVAAAIED